MCQISFNIVVVLKLLYEIHCFFASALSLSMLVSLKSLNQRIESFTSKRILHHTSKTSALTYQTVENKSEKLLNIDK